MRLAPPFKPGLTRLGRPEMVAVRDCGAKGLAVVVVVTGFRPRLTIAVLVRDAVDAVLNGVGLARCATRVAATVAECQSAAAAQAGRGDCHEKKTPREDTY